MTSPTEPAFDLHDLDEATADLIIQLQLDDLEDLHDSRSGKEREGTTLDANVATDLLKRNLEEARSQLSDRRMTKSIAEAVHADAGILTNNTLEEENTSDDRFEVAQSSTTVDEALLPILAGRYVSEHIGEQLALDQSSSSIQDPTEDDDEAEGSKWAASRHRKPAENRLTKKCIACQEAKRLFEVVLVPCNHHYCRECVQVLFSAALTDESLFPPRCCRQSIPIELVSVFLTKRIKDEFELKKIEFSTPNRTYCCRSSCSAFVASAGIADDVATCPECSTQTCTICNSQAHVGSDCPNDTPLQAVVDLAREEGWQRCYSCRRLVELEVGCNHMTYAFLLLVVSFVLTLLDVTAEQSSVTSVHSHGRLVPVHSGTRIVSSPVRTKLLNATN